MDTKGKVSWGILLAAVPIAFTAWQVWRSEQDRADLEVSGFSAPVPKEPRLKAFLKELREESLVSSAGHYRDEQNTEEYFRVSVHNSGKATAGEVRLDLVEEAYSVEVRRDTGVEVLKEQQVVTLGSLLPAETVVVTAWTTSTRGAPEEVKYMHLKGNGTGQIQDLTKQTLDPLQVGLLGVLFGAIGGAFLFWLVILYRALPPVVNLRLAAPQPPAEGKVSEGGSPALARASIPDNVLNIQLGPSDHALIRRRDNDWELDFEIRFLNAGQFPVTIKSLMLTWQVHFTDPVTLTLESESTSRRKEVFDEFKPILPQMPATYRVTVPSAPLGESTAHTARLGVACDYRAAADGWDTPRKGYQVVSKLGPVQYLVSRGGRRSHG